MELDEYINLEQRVSGRMVLLDISATGEENLIEQQSGNPMNDLEYRRKQLLKLQDTVIDLEDLSSGVSITDLTLTDFRIDLAQYLKATPASSKPCRWGVCRHHQHGRRYRAGRHFLLRAEGLLPTRLPMPAIRWPRISSSMSAKRARSSFPYPGQAHPGLAQTRQSGP
jgi:hypothetical protein